MEIKISQPLLHCRAIDISARGCEWRIVFSVYDGRKPSFAIIKKGANNSRAGYGQVYNKRVILPVLFQFWNAQRFRKVGGMKLYRLERKIWEMLYGKRPMDGVPR